MFENFKTKKYTIEKSFRHHLIEWAASIITIIGAVMNAMLMKEGFYLFTFANILWISFSVKHRHYGLFISSLFLLAVNIYGLFAWK